jgi:hypothetical protein
VPNAIASSSSNPISNSSADPVTAFPKYEHYKDSGDNRLNDKLMEYPVEYPATSTHPRPVRPLDDPDFIGAEAALKRASAKAVARGLAAGLESVVRTRPLFLKTE